MTTVKTFHIKPNSGVISINISISYRHLLFWIIALNAAASIVFIMFTGLKSYDMLEDHNFHIHDNYVHLPAKRSYLLPAANFTKTAKGDARLQQLDAAISNFNNKSLNSTSQNNFVIITNTNEAFIEITDNWLISIQNLGLKYNISLMCEDEQTYRYFAKRTSDLFRVINTKKYNMAGRLHRKMTNSYQQLIRRRTIYVRDTLFTGIDVLLADVDMVWLKDPIQEIRQSYGSYDLWIAQGQDVGVPCPCFMYMKSVPSVMNLVRRWSNRLIYKPSNHVMETDQNALQYVLQSAHETGTGTMHVRILNLSRKKFPTGVDFFDPIWNKININEVLVAHANHQGREEAKIKKLKEYGLWFVGGKKKSSRDEKPQRGVLIGYEKPPRDLSKSKNIENPPRDLLEDVWESSEPGKPV